MRLFWSEDEPSTAVLLHQLFTSNPPSHHFDDSFESRGTAPSLSGAGGGAERTPQGNGWATFGTVLLCDLPVLVFENDQLLDVIAQLRSDALELDDAWAEGEGNGDHQQWVRPWLGLSGSVCWDST